MKKINAFLATLEHELSITVYAIFVTWTIGLILPVTFLVM